MSPSLVINDHTDMPGSCMQAGLRVGWELVLGSVQALLGGLGGRRGASKARGQWQKANRYTQLMCHADLC